MSATLIINYSSGSQNRIPLETFSVTFSGTIYFYRKVSQSIANPISSVQIEIQPIGSSLKIINLDKYKIIKQNDNDLYGAIQVGTDSVGYYVSGYYDVYTENNLFPKTMLNNSEIFPSTIVFADPDDDIQVLDTLDFNNSTTILYFKKATHLNSVLRTLSYMDSDTDIVYQNIYVVERKGKTSTANDVVTFESKGIVYNVEPTRNYYVNANGSLYGASDGLFNLYYYISRFEIEFNNTLKQKFYRNYNILIKDQKQFDYKTGVYVSGSKDAEGFYVYNLNYYYPTSETELKFKPDYTNNLIITLKKNKQKFSQNIYFQILNIGLSDSKHLNSYVKSPQDYDAILYGIIISFANLKLDIQTILFQKYQGNKSINSEIFYKFQNSKMIDIQLQSDLRTNIFLSITNINFNFESKFIDGNSIYNNKKIKKIFSYVGVEDYIYGIYVYNLTNNYLFNFEIANNEFQPIKPKGIVKITKNVEKVESLWSKKNLIRHVIKDGVIKYTYNNKGLVDIEYKKIPIILNDSRDVVENKRG